MGSTADGNQRIARFLGRPLADPGKDGCRLHLDGLLRTNRAAARRVARSVAMDDRVFLLERRVWVM